MFRRFHEFTPDDLRPHVEKANTKEISFKGQESGLKIATAGSQDVGRSETIQAFWGSEQAFWENSEEHSAGIRQAISGADGSEDIRESTANGLNSYYREWSGAVRGQSDYIPVFLPWFLDPLYRYMGDEKLSFTQEWLEYGDLYSLSETQLAWAYRKNREMAGTLGLDFGEPCWQFKQEYPSNSSEAFLSSGDETFISTLAVAQSRQARASKYGPRVLGVDPARGGGDKTALVDRQGRRLGLEVCELIDEPDLMVLAGRIVNIQREKNFDKIILDVTGLGAGLYDRLRELLGDRVVGVNFSSRPSHPGKYANKRAEIWAEMRDWFTQTPNDVQMVDRDDLAMDILAPIWGPGATVFMSNGAVRIEPKEKIKERLGQSPDLGDAAALTFGYPMQMEARDRSRRKPEQIYDRPYNPTGLETGGLRHDF